MSNTESEPLTFASLPTELRLQIWRAALPLFPRIIRIRPHKHAPHSQQTRYRITPLGSSTLLAVNREARYELLSLYNLPFSIISMMFVPGAEIRLPAIDPRGDILFFDIEDTRGEPTSNPGRDPDIASLPPRSMALYGPVNAPRFLREVRVLAGTLRWWKDNFSEGGQDLLYKMTKEGALEELILVRGEESKRFLTTSKGEFRDIEKRERTWKEFHWLEWWESKDYKGAEFSALRCRVCELV